MDPLTITTSSIALLTTSIKIKRYLQSVANAPRVLERLSADCDRALHLLRAAQCRIDRRRRHDDDEETYQDIQLLLQDTVRSVFPHCLELRNEITHLSSVPTTRYEEIRRQALRSRDVSRLEAIYAKIHPMMEDIHMFEQATNADMLDRIHEALIRTRPSQMSSSAQARLAHRHQSSAASSRSNLATATTTLPFEDTGPGALVWAIMKKELRDVRMILEFMEVDPNFTVPGDNGQSPLHLAASLNQGGIVKLLLNNGADITALDTGGWSVLRAACKEGHADHPESVHALLEANADPNEHWHHGRTALWYLAWHGKAPSTLALLLDIGPHVVNYECSLDRTYPTALWAAAENGKLESARELLTAGANPDVRNSSGSTLLHHVEWTNADKLAPLLLQHNADPAVADNRGCQPIHCAAEAGRGGIVRLLLNTGNVQVNTPDGTGGTALMLAAGAGAARLVRDLVAELGADVQAEDDDGNDAFHYAAAGGYVLVAAYLLGASLKTLVERDIDKFNRNKYTALYAAAHAGHKAMVAWLLDQGADPVLVTDENIMVGAVAGNEEITKLIKQDMA